MSKLVMCLAAASALAMGGSAVAQTPAPPPPTPPVNQPMTPTPLPPATAPADAPQPTPPNTMPPATPAPTPAPASPAPSTAPAPAAAPAPLAMGMTVKDKTGAAIGQITKLEPDATGTQSATIKMGADVFAVAASGLVVMNGSAVINMTQAELQAQVHKPKA